MQNILMSSMVFVLFALISVGVSPMRKKMFIRTTLYREILYVFFLIKILEALAPVIATSPCDGKPTHAHVIVDTTREKLARYTR